MMNSDFHPSHEIAHTAPQSGTHLGERLVASGRLEARDLEQALLAQRSMGGPLGRVLVGLGLVSELDVARALSSQLGIPLVEADRFPQEAIAVPGLGVEYLQRHGVLPIAIGDGWCEVAMVTPQDGFLIKALQLATGLDVRAAIALDSELTVAQARLFGRDDGSLEHARDETPEDGQDGDFIEHLKDLASEAPVITLVNRIVARVVDLRASDIHIEPFEDGLHVRYRVDGVLLAPELEDLRLAAAVTSRIKLLAHLNIAERRLPQDGRIRTRVKGHELDLRVSTLPTVHGESVVMRVLDRASLRVELEDMGFSADTLQRYRQLIARPHGIVLVTGPTGSGKTTTLYASLAKLDADALKILTVEDPVEYQLAGVNQIQVQPQIGLGFAQALRAILRQDPDIIMIGEMRDTETARIAVQSALTGHLVLSTLHTNTAAAAITRLEDMGIERYLITSTISGVLAQRLIRTLCPQCKMPQTLSLELLESTGLDRLIGSGDARIHEARGCKHCKYTGYRGRTAIHELLVLDPTCRQAILAGADAGGLQSVAHSAGMGSLYEDGLRRVLAGDTSLDEVLRVTQDEHHG